MDDRRMVYAIYEGLYTMKNHPDALAVSSAYAISPAMFVAGMLAFIDDLEGEEMPDFAVGSKPIPDTVAIKRPDPAIARLRTALERAQRKV